MKVIKEIMIMLLVCLVGILLFAVVFYEYIPSRKEVSEVAAYEPTSAVKEQLSDNIDQMDEQVILTFEQGDYEVTSTDLNRYKNKNIYVPGKANPFATVSNGSEGDVNNNSTSGGSSKSGNSSNSNTKDNNSSEYMNNKGTK